MKRALTALFLVACASGHAIERAPATVQTTTAASSPPTTTATSTLPPALKLSFQPSRIFAGQEPNTEHAQGTLVMVMSDEDVHRLDELDIASMVVFRSLDLGRDDFAAVEKHGDSLYVVTVHVGVKVGGTHTLSRVDLNSFKVMQHAEAARQLATLHTDHAFPPFVSVGSRGVRVVYRDFCPDSVPEGEVRDAGCIFYETHRLSDLGVVKVHMLPIVNVYSATPVRVRDDYGEPPLVEDRAERDPHCATTGSMPIDSVWVGDNYFALKFGCCDEPGGGFFQCKAPREK
jgi:hypothetical protein